MSRSWWRLAGGKWWCCPSAAAVSTSVAAVGVFCALCAPPAPDVAFVSDAPRWIAVALGSIEEVEAPLPPPPRPRRGPLLWLVVLLLLL